MGGKTKKPKWVPEEADDSFTTKVMEGVSVPHDGMGERPNTTGRKRIIKPRKVLTLEDYYQGVINQNKTIMARGITLVESNAVRHFNLAQELIHKLMPHTGRSIRVGISGVPGAGKSTLIESLGLYLCHQGHKVAVLAVDPSSSITGGSILGDKTRMEELSRHENSFIRPSPSGGTLGGVTRKSRETILLCEAAGYDIILVETVGVGQNEIAVRSMVDFFLLVLITGGGDELQAMKKGVMEICDLIAVNKADGSNENEARVAQREFNNMLHYSKPATEGWKSTAVTCSALYNKGIKELWDHVEAFKENTQNTSVFEERRKTQNVEWVFNLVTDQLISRFYNHPGVKGAIPNLKEAISDGKITATKAAIKLINIYDVNV